MAMKNPFAKSRKPGNGYFVCSNNSGWNWEVLKVWKGPSKCKGDPYARAFCNVKSPFVPYGEMGDVYCNEIPGFYAAMHAAEIAMSRAIAAGMFDSPK